MREILFRGKRKDNGEWAYGSLLTFKGFSIHDKTWKNFLTVRGETIGQYTGLKDKNGRMIFEGDVVEQSLYSYVEPICDGFGEVVFCECDCSFSVFCASENEIMPLGSNGAYYWEAEVLGNIHDNPELVKKGVKNKNA